MNVWATDKEKARMFDAANVLEDVAEILNAATMIPEKDINVVEMSDGSPASGSDAPLHFCASCMSCLTSYRGDVVMVSGVEGFLAHAAERAGGATSAEAFLKESMLEGRLEEDVLFNPYNDLRDLGMKPAEEPHDIPPQAAAKFLTMLSVRLREKANAGRSDVFANDTPNSNAHDEAAVVMDMWSRAAINAKVDSEDDKVLCSRLFDRCESVSDMFNQASELERERNFVGSNFAEQRRRDMELYGRD